MTTMWGADIVALRALGGKFRVKADELENTAQQLSLQSAQAGWGGSDAQQFERVWQGEHRPRLLAIASALRTSGERLLQQAMDQERTSNAGAGGGFSGGGGGGGGGGSWGRGWPFSSDNDPILDAFRILDYSGTAADIAELVLRGPRPGLPLLDMGLDGAEAYYAYHVYGPNSAAFYEPVVSGVGTGVSYVAAFGVAIAGGATVTAAGTAGAVGATAFGVGMIGGHLLNWGSQRLTGSTVSQHWVDATPADADLDAMNAKLDAGGLLNEDEQRRLDELGTTWGALKSLVGF